MYELLHNEDLKPTRGTFDNQYSDILGTAFYNEEWQAARAFNLTNIYTDLHLKFDTYANRFYANINDTIYDISKSGITQIDIFPDQADTSKVISFVNGYSFGELKPEMFVNVLSEGKITFIKYYKKSLEEVYESSPTYKEKKFLDKNRYYIVEDENGKEITISKKNLEAILKSKWEEISKYAKEKGISSGNEDGWRKLIDYYNSLK